MPFQEPRIPFLNVEYLFYQIFRFFRVVAGTIDYYIFGGALGTGYVPGSGNVDGDAGSNGAGNESGTGDGFFGVSQADIIVFLKFFAALLAIALFVIIAYSFIRLLEIRAEQKKRLTAVVDLGPEPTAKNEQWEKVMERVNSTHPAEWKLAILEADSMLDDLIRRMGYKGENLGERLKAVEPSDFQNIQSAWEAHKIRNRIAHEGSEYTLSQREARRIVDLYGDVFREFYYI